ncbi:hypothetical protein B0H16DRAFT_1479998 [Mycena metata]|uniref:Uncharacterized protein n=1 Tax=Mycena metata TaxID=1033252 RepID=A0AAD7MD73_9AGAR|nr:hypothetical protein B0H16DRAFT_1479998 [Mycena metata]
MPRRGGRVRRRRTKDVTRGASSHGENKMKKKSIDRQRFSTEARRATASPQSGVHPAGCRWTASAYPSTRDDGGIRTRGGAGAVSRKRWTRGSKQGHAGEGCIGAFVYLIGATRLSALPRPPRTPRLHADDGEDTQERVAEFRGAEERGAGSKKRWPRVVKAETRRRGMHQWIIFLIPAGTWIEWIPQTTTNAPCNAEARSATASTESVVHPAGLGGGQEAVDESVKAEVRGRGVHQPPPTPHRYADDGEAVHQCLGTILRPAARQRRRKVVFTRRWCKWWTASAYSATIAHGGSRSSGGAGRGVEEAVEGVATSETGMGAVERVGSSGGGMPDAEARCAVRGGERRGRGTMREATARGGDRQGRGEAVVERKNRTIERGRRGELEPTQRPSANAARSWRVYRPSTGGGRGGTSGKGGAEAGERSALGGRGDGRRRTR